MMAFPSSWLSQPVQSLFVLICFVTQFLVLGHWLHCMFCRSQHGEEHIGSKHKNNTCKDKCDRKISVCLHLCKILTLSPLFESNPKDDVYNNKNNGTVARKRHVQDDHNQRTRKQ